MVRPIRAVDLNAEPDTGWRLVDHVCRSCLGRIVERNGVFLCSGCERTATGKPDAICGCGMHLDGMPISARTLFRCDVNPNQGPTSPARIVITYGGTAATPRYA